MHAAVTLKVTLVTSHFLSSFSCWREWTPVTRTHAHTHTHNNQVEVEPLTCASLELIRRHVSKKNQASCLNTFYNTGTN
jgi:hypothetical protein